MKNKENKIFIELEGIVELPDTWSVDDFLDKFIEFVVSKKGTFGGGAKLVNSYGDEVDEQGNIKITYKQFILRTLAEDFHHVSNGFSITQLTKLAHQAGLPNAKADGFSSILAKLRKEGKIYVSNKRAIKGGMIYKIKKSTVKSLNMLIL